MGRLAVGVSKRLLAQRILGLICVGRWTAEPAAYVVIRWNFQMFRPHMIRVLICMVVWAILYRRLSKVLKLWCCIARSLAKLGHTCAPSFPSFSPRLSRKIGHLGFWGGVRVPPSRHQGMAGHRKATCNTHTVPFPACMCFG